MLSVNGSSNIAFSRVLCSVFALALLLFEIVILALGLAAHGAAHLARTFSIFQFLYTSPSSLDASVTNRFSAAPQGRCEAAGNRDQVSNQTWSDDSTLKERSWFMEREERGSVRDPGDPTIQGILVKDSFLYR
jgi:hypothetical protein